MTTRQAPPTAAQPHPAGLYVLFFTEMWERYSFYSMMAILTLYMDEALHFSQQAMGQIYGGYIAGVYFMPLVGGFIADRYLGYNRAVLAGAALMGMGQFLLAMPPLPFFFAALGLLACGSGLLKPNISTIVGNLYRDRPHLRDAGFNIFYMGINIGAFISPLVVSYLRATYGWSVAFASAGVAMILAIITFLAGNRLIAVAARKVEAGSREATSVDPADARARTLALIVIFAIAVAFWIAFYQNGFTLTFWARDNTATTIAPERFQSVNPLCIILFTPLLVRVWAWLRSRGAEPSTIMKILIGMLVTTGAYLVMMTAGLVGGDTGRVSPGWLVSAYALISLGEISLSPMGLSLVTKIAPPRRRGLLMGGWFVALSLGGYFSGSLGTYWYQMPHSRFFLIVACLILVAAAILMLVRRRLHAVFAAAEG